MDLRSAASAAGEVAATASSAGVGEPVGRVALPSLDDKVVRFTSGVSDEIWSLIHGTKYHGAAQELESVGRRLDAFKWELQPHVGLEHPVLAEIDAHTEALDKLVATVRQDHGFWDPWTPTTRQAAQLNGTYEFLTGVELAHLQGNLRSPLEDVRAALRATTTLPSELLPVREQTLALLDLNLARMQGTTPQGAVVGYLNHPDYAEVGRIQANIQFMQDALDAAPDPGALTW
ncbi:MAG: hypothetical protein JWL76_261 [Thermoleophilia bacterium]|nr:hypothetical protein [Thermoleophilia bacterium]